MKKIYSKPIAQKVAFSYQDQVVANSPSSGNGQMYNDDNNPNCQFVVENCGRFWYASASQASLYSLNNCAENP